MDIRDRWSPVTRLATGAAVLYCGVFAVMEVGVIATSWGAGSWEGITALLATAGYLPFHVRHVWYGAHAARPPGGGWTLAVMAVVVAGATPLVGAGWIPSFHAVVASAMIVLRRPWSYVAAATVTVVALPCTLALDDPWPAAWRSAVDVLWRGTALFVLVWLSAALRNLDEARRAVADEAVVRERQEIDRELTHTLGSALEGIAARAERIRAGAVPDGGSVVDDLRELVDASRNTLAEARRMVVTLRHRSLRTELDAAAALLRAAGVETSVDAGTAGPGDVLEEASRAALRAATARTLNDPTVSRCVITFDREHGRVSVRVTGTRA